MIKQVDEYLLLLFNSHHTYFWDFFWLFFTDKWIGFFLVLSILLLIWKKSNFKVLFVIGLVLVVGITATEIMATLVKNTIARPRPCSTNTEISQHIRILSDGLFKGKFVDSNAIKCEKFSFFSAHAAVSFFLAAFLGRLLKQIHKNCFILLLVWAFCVSISRVYLGFHYPSDILVGSVFGFGIGSLCYEIYHLLCTSYFKYYRFNCNK